MSTLIELTTQIVTAQASMTAMSTDSIVSALTRIHSTLGQLESGVPPVSVRERAAAPTPVSVRERAAAPAPVSVKETAEQPLCMKDAFKMNEVICLICGKSFKTLGHHLQAAHSLKSSDYRKRFGIPRNQPLSSWAHFELRKKLALESDMAGKMAKGRALAKEVSAEEGPNAATVTAETPVDLPLKRQRGRPRKTVTVLSI